MRLYIQVLTVVASLFARTVICRRTPVFKPHRDVSTPQGTIRGYLTPTHTAYLGIPYAHPPTRPHRYKAPEPPPTWDGIFEASHKIKCPQLEEDADENCLVVNIFAPRHPTLLPVYVLVHDGGLNSGWGPHEPINTILKEGYVIVTFNYRLGALGFLCLNTEEAQGNAGLKDQKAALHWISNNIEYFGGDPDEVILHGIKSAATTIQLLLISGSIDGLVHKVIIESHSALSPFSITYDPVSIAYRGAISLGYNGAMDIEEMLKFYNKTPWRDLVTISETFYLCIEDEFYADSLINFDPLNRLKEGNFVNVPIMITYTDINDITGTENIDKVIDNIAEILPNNLAFDNDMIEQQIGQIVKEFYFGNGAYDLENAEQSYHEYNYDIFVEYPTVLFTMLYAAKSPYMVYLLKFINENSFEDSSVRTSGTILDNLNRGGDDDDIHLERLLTLWRNFIKMGDPTPITTNLIPIIWQPVVTEIGHRTAITNVQTLNFGNKLKMTPPPTKHQLLFWYNIYSKFYKPYHTEQDHSEDIEESFGSTDHTN